MKHVLILGASSSIASAVAREYARKGYKLSLVARDKAKLDCVVADLTAYGAKSIATYTSDLADCSSHQALIDKIDSQAKIDQVLVAYGILGSQQEGEADFESAKHVLDVNLISVISLVTLIANVFASRHSGTIAVITSVAGDRGRALNYIYGASKAGVSTFLSGVRARLAVKGVKVVDIRPGFIDTPMTAQLKRSALASNPRAIAPSIVRAIEAGVAVCYVPWFWRFIMIIIKLLPEPIFQKMRF